jgi:hypothetical protein
MPDCTIAGFPNRVLRKFIVWDFQLLKAHSIGPRFCQPAEQIRQAGSDAIDVEGRDFQEPTPASFETSQGAGPEPHPSERPLCETEFKSRPSRSEFNITVVIVEAWNSRYESEALILVLRFPVPALKFPVRRSEIPCSVIQGNHQITQ